ncbi:hypothetical protein TPB0596_32740 [Tsukamurella pulmonis]|uniref:DUF3558 domain-containing protein n=1 Tax=Tsukamurella pulmonis TaxID=47312 RepID=A0A1H1DA54_9ACTN|nr:DUF3558 domain-containing protein [Tsukamurella pulmonis]BDD83511.1 hypothetical protein TPB0596_32740 [Tsukamurella pulmonis]SDQ73431.1 Protein of unknown function [Tsukamurella pulmonis]SUP22280.1 Uncharacterised protein [Tsukamurella pulmonis]
MRVLSVAIVLTVLASGCAVAVSGEPTSSLESPSPTSQKPLPFTPTIKNRTNDRTDGTTFEPCSAYTNDELRALNIDPASVHDAAQVDDPNYRGCRWLANGYNDVHGGGDYSQIVGRELTLDQYKRYMSALRWQTDRIVNGRVLAYAPENNYCIAAFSSEESIVTTIAESTTPSPGNVTECDRAIAFASLAITKAP